MKPLSISNVMNSMNSFYLASNDTLSYIHLLPLHAQMLPHNCQAHTIHATEYDHNEEMIDYCSWKKVGKKNSMMNEGNRRTV